MKAVLVFALLATIALSSKYSEFETIEKSKLGKTLFDTIAIQLSTGEPLEYLFTLLHGLEDQYLSDQKQDDSINNDFQSKCDSDLNALDNDIAQSTKKQVDLQETIDSVTPIRDQKVQQRQDKVTAREDLQVVINENTETRAEENAVFEEKSQEFQYVSSILGEARRYFTDNLGSSFLQSETVRFTPQVMAQVGTHLTAGASKINKMKHTKSYGKAIKLLASLATRIQSQPDQEVVEKLVSLIDQLQDQLNASFDLERKAEDKRLDAFNQYMSLLNGDLNQYNTSIANFDAEISSNNDRLEQSTNSLNDVTQRISDKTEQRNDRNNECKEASYDYQNTRSTRDGDRSTVSSVIGLLNANLRDLKEYIAQRGGE